MDASCVIVKKPDMVITFLRTGFHFFGIIMDVYGPKEILHEGGSRLGKDNVKQKGYWKGQGVLEGARGIGKAK